MIEVTVFSHHFTVTGYGQLGYQFVKRFAFRYAHFQRQNNFPRRGWKQQMFQEPVLERLYASFSKNRRLCRLHRNTYDDFIQACREENIDITVREAPLYEVPDINVRILDKFTDKDYQIPITDYLCEPGKTKVVSLQTGRGKTYCALRGACNFGGRIWVSIEPKFFELWAETVMDGPKKILDVDYDTEVLFVSGEKELINMVNLFLANELQEVKVIIVSSVTLALFYKAYSESNGLSGKVLDCPIEHIYEAAGVGPSIKDEVHRRLHANFIEELYMHLHMRISLSATMEAGDELDRIFKLMFPLEGRAPTIENLRYIKVFAAMYTLVNPFNAVYTRRGRSDYSHGAFENWLLSNPKRRQNYLDLVLNLYEQKCVNILEPGQHGSIIVQEVETANAFVAEIEKRFPHQSVARFCKSAGDEWEVANKAVHLVTTSQSFGTGIDLDNLRINFITVSQNSARGNKQAVGRTREPKGFTYDPECYYFVCSDINKHLTYHDNKKVQFLGLVKEHNTMFLDMSV